MRRLFITFPDGRAGCGLLTLRIGLTAALMSCALHQTTFFLPAWERCAAVIAAMLLLMGLFTPAVAIVCVTALLIASLGGVPPSRFMSLLLTLTFAATGLLGAGAYSLDARLYGRRRLISRPPPR